MSLHGAGHPIGDLISEFDCIRNIWIIILISFILATLLNTIETYLHFLLLQTLSLILQIGYLTYLLPYNLYNWLFLTFSAKKRIFKCRKVAKCRLLHPKFRPPRKQSISVFYVLIIVLNIQLIHILYFGSLSLLYTARIMIKGVFKAEIQSSMLVEVPLIIPSYLLLLHSLPKYTLSGKHMEARHQM